MIAAAHTLMRRNIEGLLTIIVPRHPERGGGLAATLGGLGLRDATAVQSPDPEPETEIYVADTYRRARNVLCDLRPSPSLADRSSSTAAKTPSRLSVTAPAY